MILNIEVYLLRPTPPPPPQPGVLQDNSAFLMRYLDIMQISSRLLNAKEAK